ncbi:MAG: elongation factor 4 [Candidatus Zambryskibacteria bacterium]|nr:elongation factor 4 [Candidatus Zambryskibacteria bacterium]
MTDKIRNFSIIAHVDHGKSTLADRMLELTGTIEKRKMQNQVLDSMELERERGITIKMQPVRMKYKDYILNLIDTPGHIDFSYEVSRALKAVEGSILLVDATQGVQAQTLTTLGMARESGFCHDEAGFSLAKSGLTIIPVISKIDSPLARVEEVCGEVCKLLNCEAREVLKVSGKTGEGVENLLSEIVKKIPPPNQGRTLNTDSQGPTFRSLVFDFKYSTHRGMIVFVRVMSGSVSRNTPLIFKVSKEKFSAIEVGIFSPDEKPRDSLEAGEIGYIVTGIKEPGAASVGDTVASMSDTRAALPGYEKPHPVVWASVYPENANDFIFLKQSFGKLKLSDSSFTYEEETSGALGRGFRCGFLGMLHLEIITERLRREFRLNLVVTTPTITYEVTYKNGKHETIYSSAHFPDEGLLREIREPWVSLAILLPANYLGAVMPLLYEYEAELESTETFGENRNKLTLKMPLRELMRNFFDKLKRATSGFASISYEIAGQRDADVVRLDILVADEVLPAFSRVISRRIVEEEAEAAVEKLHGLLPRQMFAMKIQAKALGRIISSKSVSAFRKDVTQHMYGGDITRKMKLREKQKKGKKKMKNLGKINIPQDVFIKMLKS